MIIIPDISKWQDAPATPKLIDFVKMKTLTPAVIIKASQATYTDPEFAESWANSKAAGLIRGCYHYLDWSRSGQEQADYFCSVFKSDPPDMPPVVDYEEAVGIPANHLEHLQDFVSRMEELTGCTPAIYTGPAFWKAYGSIDPYWAKFPLWIANWYVAKPLIPTPWTDYFLWQHTPKGDGLAYGVESLQIDLSQYQGTVEDLKKFCGVTASPVVHPTICPTCGQFWPPDVVNNYRVKANSNLNVYYPTKDSRPSQGLLMAGTPVYIKDYAAMTWYAFFEPTLAFPKGGWIYKSYLEKI